MANRGSNDRLWNRRSLLCIGGFLYENSMEKDQEKDVLSVCGRFPRCACVRSWEHRVADEGRSSGRLVSGACPVIRRIPDHPQGITEMNYEHIILEKGIHRISAADEYWD